MSIDRRIVKEGWHTHSMEYYSAIKKDEALPFTATWMVLEIIISEVSHRKTNTMFYHLYVKSKI